MQKKGFTTLACVIFLTGLSLSSYLRATETVTYSYDALGRLIIVSHAGSANNGTTARYCYDQAGNRSQVVVAGVNGASSPQARCGTGSNGTDFNGDGIDDILWRSSTGQLSDWLGTSNGAFTNDDANAYSVVGTDWKMVGVGDFNGDGRADILWRNTTSGDLSDWLGQPNGGFVSNDSNAYTPVPLSYQVVGVGDFNGDGYSDILWRGSDGTITDWLGTSTGGFRANDANASTAASTDWTVAGTGDFNGDGRTDIVWRRSNGALSEWLGKANGGFLDNGAIAGAQVDTSWIIAGVGDFNGDGYSDLLWRNTSGQLTNWLGRADGGFNDNSANASYQVDVSWQVVGTGDYNGDRRSDILWRNSSGALSNWLGNSSGAFTNNDAQALTSAPTNWYVQGPTTFK